MSQKSGEQGGTPISLAGFRRPVIARERVSQTVIAVRDSARVVAAPHVVAARRPPTKDRSFHNNAAPEGRKSPSAPNGLHDEAGEAPVSKAQLRRPQVEAQSEPPDQENREEPREYRVFVPRQREGEPPTQTGDNNGDNGGPPDRPREHDENGEEYDPTPNRPLARAMARRYLTEFQLDALEGFGEQGEPPSVVEQGIETASVLIYLALMENPNMRINAERIAEAAVTPEDIREKLPDWAIDNPDAQDEVLGELHEIVTRAVNGLLGLGDEITELPEFSLHKELKENGEHIVEELRLEGDQEISLIDIFSGSDPELYKRAFRGVYHDNLEEYITEQQEFFRNIYGIADEEADGEGEEFRLRVRARARRIWGPETFDSLPQETRDWFPAVPDTVSENGELLLGKFPVVTFDPIMTSGQRREAILISRTNALDEVKISPETRRVALSELADFAQAEEAEIAEIEDIDAFNHFWANAGRALHTLLQSSWENTEDTTKTERYRIDIGGSVVLTNINLSYEKDFTREEQTEKVLVESEAGHIRIRISNYMGRDEVFFLSDIPVEGSNDENIFDQRPVTREMLQARTRKLQQFLKDYVLNDEPGQTREIFH